MKKDKPLGAYYDAPTISKESLQRILYELSKQEYKHYKPDRYDDVKAFLEKRIKKQINERKGWWSVECRDGN